MRSQNMRVRHAVALSKHRAFTGPNSLLAFSIAGILSTAAHAQQAPNSSADASDTSKMEEVIVTGTMIKRVNAETAEAITVLKSDALEDQGIQNLEQALSTVTSANPSINVATSVGTFSGGGSYADLR